MTLLQRVVAGNALVVFVGAMILAISPATVSAKVTAGEALLLAAGAAGAVALNVVVMRRALAPLRALAVEMARVDLLAPAPAGAPRSGVAEVATLGRAYDAMVERLLAERRVSARRAIEAQEAERARIGRELHDEVGQALTGVALELQAVAGPDVRFDAAREALRSASDGVREITDGLRPSPLEDFGLRGALVSLTSTLADRSRLRVRRELAVGLPALAPETELVVYRVAQEALTNVARHASAREVVVGVDVEGDMMVLVVRDDGVGRRGAAEGTGVQGMRERALLVGGRLSIGDAPGGRGGTEVRLAVPLA
jgi:two-component system sensor histidine kinase UhpB